MTLQNILAKHGTDKDTLHSYGPVYRDLLAPYRDDAKWVLELGIASGGSLRAWRDYFTAATIVGFDSNPARLIFAPRIHSVAGNQACREDLLKFPDSLGIRFDVIIDDCSHQIDHQVMSAFWLWPYLQPGGVYVIEDIQKPEALRHFSCFAGMVATHDLRKAKGRYDDIMVVIRKPHLGSEIGCPAE